MTTPPIALAGVGPAAAAANPYHRDRIEAGSSPAFLVFVALIGAILPPNARRIERIACCDCGPGPATGRQTRMLPLLLLSAA
jgi:hypothetical protein